MHKLVPVILALFAVFFTENASHAAGIFSSKPDVETSDDVPTSPAKPEPTPEAAETSDPTTIEQKSNPVVVEASDDKPEAIDLRSPRATASLIYSPIDLIIPSKIGAAFGYRPGSGTVFELEYLRGTIAIPFLIDDIGSFVDERFTLLVRGFSDAKSSFNFFYGASLVHTKLTLGSALLGRVSGQIPSGYDVMNFMSIAPVIGIGNRWKFNNGITFSVDWVSLTQPIAVLKEDMPLYDSVSDANDRDDLDTFKKVVSYFPRLTLLKLELGFSF